MTPTEGIGESIMWDLGAPSSGDILIHAYITPVSASQTSITLSTPPEALVQVVSPKTTHVAARYSSSGALLWGVDLAKLLGDAPATPVGRINGISMTTNDDFVLGYDRSDSGSPMGPGSHLSRIDGRSPKVVWTADSNFPVAFVLPRPSKTDYIATGYPSAPGQYVMQVGENAGATVPLMPYIGVDSKLGLDGVTLWSIGGNVISFPVSGSTRFNPWATTTWNVTSTTSFLTGARDSGSILGPWFSTGTPTNFDQVLPDSNGDVIVFASGGPGAKLNGKLISPNGGQVMFKVTSSTGDVAWTRDLTDYPGLVSIAPDGAILSVSGPFRGTLYDINIYSDVDGHLLTSFTASGWASAAIAQKNGIVVGGMVTETADFNPGIGVDTQGNLPGFFVTRFSY